MSTITPAASASASETTAALDFLEPTKVTVVVNGLGFGFVAAVRWPSDRAGYETVQAIVGLAVHAGWYNGKFPRGGLGSLMLSRASMRALIDAAQTRDAGTDPGTTVLTRSDVDDGFVEALTEALKNGETVETAHSMASVEDLGEPIVKIPLSLARRLVATSVVDKRSLDVLVDFHAAPVPVKDRTAQRDFSARYARARKA